MHRGMERSLHHSLACSASRGKGSTCGLDEDVVKPVALLHEGFQGPEEVALDAAAQAAVCQLNPLLQGVCALRSGGTCELYDMSCTGSWHFEYSRAGTGYLRAAVHLLLQALLLSIFVHDHRHSHAMLSCQDPMYQRRLACEQDTPTSAEAVNTI